MIKLDEVTERIDLVIDALRAQILTIDEVTLRLSEFFGAYRAAYKKEKYLLRYHRRGDGVRRKR